MLLLSFIISYLLNFYFIIPLIASCRAATSVIDPDWHPDLPNHYIEKEKARKYARAVRSEVFATNQKDNAH